MGNECIYRCRLSGRAFSGTLCSRHCRESSLWWNRFAHYRRTNIVLIVAAVVLANRECISLHHLNVLHSGARSMWYHHL